MSVLQRASFRHWLVLAFLLIAGVLAAVSLRGLGTLEKLMAQSREAAGRAASLSADAQLLADRTLTMERAARQYLVLDDAVLKARYAAAAADAGGALERLQAGAEVAGSAEAWQERRAAVEAALAGPRSTARGRDIELAADFRELQSINAEIAERLRSAGERHARALLQEQDDARRALRRHVLMAIAFAVAMALGFSVWLAMPLKRLETAIVGLGENRLDRPIDIAGPADLRRLGRRLDWLRQRLGELDADKARFLRHVSHELKTPLAALREGVALLEDGVAGPLSDNQREVARILRQNAQVLQQQIEDLLRFNAAAFEARRLVRRRTELSELLARCIEEQRLQWQARRLHVELAAPVLWAEVDADKLRAAFANLLSNAIRFTPLDGRIDVGLSRMDGSVRIEVVDSGPGVADADRQRLFEPFYRGERQPEGAARGSGIGLSIVHEYIAAHGGQVVLLPDGPGARFRIELPDAS
jgi:two-component system sensor histidine kinase GlrK